MIRFSVVLVAGAIACGAPSAPLGNRSPTSPLSAIDWQNRSYALFGTSFAFKDGRYADTERVLQVSPPIYVDLTGDAVDEVLVPLQIDEAETATERGNPRFHSFIVFASTNGQAVQLGELPLMVCGPQTATVADSWLRITSTQHPGREPHMCAARREERYRWDGTWFVDEDNEPVERKLY